MSHVFRLRLLNQIKGTVVPRDIIQCVYIYIYILSNDLYTDWHRVFAFLLSAYG